MTDRPWGTSTDDHARLLASVLTRALNLRQGVPVLADRAYQGAGPWVTTGLKRAPGGELTTTQRTVNRTLAIARAPVERGMARLKSWRIFRRSRCSPNRMTSIAKAVLTLERQR
ncbi:transposase family protein [Streptomyces sp. SGAir0957]